ncbi:MAG: hypothetical protein FWG90_06370 [Oscillospiraceae bacterium]|nr:hypothetical protein [Oscillospiraceae bacterium]
MNTVTVRILIFVLSLFILLTVANQLLRLFGEDYDTETAILHSSAEKITFNGVYVRNETVIYANADDLGAGNSGVLSYPNYDGSKVAKDSVVAYVYESADAIRVNRLIAELEAEAAVLLQAQNPGTTDVVQAKFISSLIEEKYQTVTSLISKGDLTALRAERKNFQELLGIYQIVIGEEVDYNDAILSLEARIADLKTRRREPKAVIRTDISGYFVSHADGYEALLSPESVFDIDAGLINRIINENSGESADPSRAGSKIIGKIIDGYEWYFAGIINTAGHSLKTDSTVKLKFASTPYLVDAKIVDIRQLENSNESLIILSCDKLNYNFVQRRSERVELILNDFEGVRIPREAIRFDPNNNDKGVYILLGERTDFKKLDIIYESDAYLLSRVTSDRAYVGVYDNIIVRGDISVQNFTSPSVREEDEEEEDVILDIRTEPIEQAEEPVEVLNTLE